MDDGDLAATARRSVVPSAGLGRSGEAGCRRWASTWRR